MGFNMNMGAPSAFDMNSNMSMNPAIPGLGTTNTAMPGLGTTNTATPGLGVPPMNNPLDPNGGAAGGNNAANPLLNMAMLNNGQPKNSQLLTTSFLQANSMPKETKHQDLLDSNASQKEIADAKQADKRLNQKNVQTTTFLNFANAKAGGGGNMFGGNMYGGGNPMFGVNGM
ncbi:hypothetical protein BDF22DRAFT_656083 [Syncephalis plumigaleata]|nr:hypothetical protein BDF22DRAFT_656083 [Syncephalis plumigaleata]